MTVPVVLLDVNPVITKTTDSLLILFNAFLASGGTSMTASGRYEPLKSSCFSRIQRPLLVRADVQIEALGKPGAERLVSARKRPLQTELLQLSCDSGVLKLERHKSITAKGGLNAAPRYFGRNIADISQKTQQDTDMVSGRTWDNK